MVLFLPPPPPKFFLNHNWMNVFNLQLNQKHPSTDFRAVTTTKWPLNERRKVVYFYKWLDCARTVKSNGRTLDGETTGHSQSSISKAVSIVFLEGIITSAVVFTPQRNNWLSWGLFSPQCILFFPFYSVFVPFKVSVTTVQLNFFRSFFHVRKSYKQWASQFVLQQNIQTSRALACAWLDITPVLSNVMWLNHALHDKE